jgi:hypothetical protein
MGIGELPESFRWRGHLLDGVGEEHVLHQGGGQWTYLVDAKAHIEAGRGKAHTHVGLNRAHLDHDRRDGIEQPPIG